MSENNFIMAKHCVSSGYDLYFQMKEKILNYSKLAHI